MTGIAGLGGALTALEGTLIESLDVAPRVDRFRDQPGDLAGRHGATRALSALLCRDVDMTSGHKVCLAASESDFVLPGRLPIAWGRFYSSGLAHAGLLGRGWRSSWEVTLQRRDDELVYTDEQGRALILPMPKRGAQVIVSSEQLHVAHLADGTLLVADLVPRFRVFGEFDTQGLARLRFVEDLDQQRIGCIWDEAGRLRRMRGTCGQELLLHYDSSDGLRLSGIERVDGGPQGFLVRYRYDDNGQLAEVHNRAGEVVRRFAYDAGMMTEEAGALGQTSRYEWAVIGGVPRVVQRMTCRGARERIEYDLDERVSRATDVSGHVAHWQTDAHGRVTEHVDFGGSRYAFSYGRAGWPTRFVLPGDRVVQAEYDTLGRVTRDTDPAGAERTSVYAFATCKPVTVRLSDGRTWTWRRDESLRPVECQVPSEGVTQFAYEVREGREIHTVSSALGRVSTFEYDHRGQLLRHVDASGAATEYRRNDEGHLTEIVDAAAAVTTIEPDAFGRPLVVTFPNGQSERHVWNAAGQLTATTGFDGQIRHWHRDQYGRVVQAVDEEANVTAHEYDAHGRRVRTVSGNGAIQTIEWNPAGRLASVVDADGVKRTFGYTAAGDLEQILTTAEGQTRRETFSYDLLGHRTARETQHAHYRYTYTADGRLESVACLPTDEGAALGVEADTIRLEYGASGRLVAEHGASGTLRYDVDAAGRKNGVMLPDRHVLKVERDDAGHVSLVGIAHEQDRLGIAAFRHDEVGREMLRSQGSLYMRTVYTSLSQIQRWFAMTVTRGPNDEMAAGDVEYWREFQYSPAGNLAQVDDRYDGRTYFDLDRRGCLLRSVSDELGIERFMWDAAGNLLEVPRVGWEPAIYPDHRLREYQGYRYEYDAWGQVTAKRGVAGDLTFSWDVDGKLMAVRSRRELVRYGYDALGRRIRKQVEWQHTDGALSETKTEVTHFIWQGNRLLQETCDEGLRIYVYRPARDGWISHVPFARVDRKRRENGSLAPMQVYHYQTDVAGTVVAMTDETGKLVWSGRYKAWGRLVPSKTMLTPIAQPLRFAGHHVDEETGLHLNGQRIYDPDTGRYLSPDRAAPAGTSPYRYVSNPLAAANPTGHAVSLARSGADVQQGVSLDRSFDFDQPLTGSVEEFDQIVCRPLFQA